MFVCLWDRLLTRAALYFQRHERERVVMSFCGEFLGRNISATARLAGQGALSDGADQHGSQ